MQRQFRLRRSADFARLRAEGRSWRHPLLTITVAPNGLSHNRYGFVTNRSVGGAVIRNRVRRVLRELVRHKSPRLKEGVDIVLIARNEIVGQSYGTVSQLLDDLFARAKLWREMDT